MRLKDADALIDKFKNKDANGINLVLDKYAIKCIEDAPTIEPEPQWIPCSERLPKEHQICIVTDETRRNTYEYRFCKETYDEEQGWTYLKHRIIAWLPMPEPWRGESNEL